MYLSSLNFLPESSVFIIADSGVLLHFKRCNSIHSTHNNVFYLQIIAHKISFGTIVFFLFYCFNIAAPVCLFTFCTSWILNELINVWLDHWCYQKPFFISRPVNFSLQNVTYTVVFIVGHVRLSAFFTRKILSLTASMPTLHSSVMFVSKKLLMI